MAASTEPLSELPVPLGNLQDVSVILGQVSLLAATGHEEDEKEVPDSLPLLRLLGFREQVKHQHFELQNVIEAEAREEATPDPLPVERLIEISKELVEEVDDMKLAYKNKTLVLQRMQFANALQSKLQEDDNESKLIRKTIGHILKLSSSVLKSQQPCGGNLAAKSSFPTEYVGALFASLYNGNLKTEGPVTRDLEQKLCDIRKKRLVLKELGAATVSEINTKKKTWKDNVEETEDEQIQMILQAIKKESDVVTIFQNVFQNIIIASQVDWAKDPKLTDIVLKLEKNLHTF